MYDLRGMARGRPSLIDQYGDRIRRSSEQDKSEAARRAALRALMEAEAERARVEAADRAKSEFLAHMSHELRTPLNAIIGFSEIIAHGSSEPDSQKHAQYAQDIHDSGRHLLALINDILDLSKMEAGRLELRETTFDVTRLAQACAALFRDQARRAGVELICVAAPGLPFLHGDETKVRQIILNLLSNAIKFTPGGGCVRLTTAVGPDKGHRVQVADTGIGMTPADLAKAMRPFMQIDNSLNRKYPGTGLGLPIIKGLMDLHGGRLELQSEVGSGTTAVVIFPPERSHG